MVGSNRIMLGAGIVHPMGNPDLDPKAEKAFRRTMVETAVKALQTEIQEQMIFSKSHLV